MTPLQLDILWRYGATRLNQMLDAVFGSNHPEAETRGVVIRETRGDEQGTWAFEVHGFADDPDIGGFSTTFRMTGPAEYDAIVARLVADAEKALGVMS